MKKNSKSNFQQYGQMKKKRKSQKKEDAGARKGRKVAIHSVFPMICGSRGSNGSLAKAAGAEPSGQMRNEQLHAVVARSRFPSQNAHKDWIFWALQATPFAQRLATHLFPWHNGILSPLAQTSDNEALLFKHSVVLACLEEV